MILQKFAVHTLTEVCGFCRLIQLSKLFCNTLWPECCQSVAIVVRRANCFIDVFKLESQEIKLMKPRLIMAVMALAATFCFAPVADAGCCAQPTCCAAPAPCCCPPPPPADVKVNWCVVDPCTGCKYPVSACVPACCKGVTPCLDGWRKGLFGRKILTYKFPCCDHCVEVVLTKRGKTIVRD